MIPTSEQTGGFREMIVSMNELEKQMNKEDSDRWKKILTDKW